VCCLWGFFLLTAATTVLQELAARLPEATAPLLRQLDAGRAAAAAQSAAWAAAEAALSQRAADAEAGAAAASEAVRTSTERLQVNHVHMQTRMSGTRDAPLCSAYHRSVEKISPRHKEELLHCRLHSPARRLRWQRWRL
jgi:hypothetical protein